MTAAWIVETIDVFENGHLSLAPCLPRSPPDQLGFDCLEERFDGGIVVTITLSTHRDHEAVQAQDLLIIVLTILTATVGMVDVFFGRLAERDGHVQRPDRPFSRM